MLHAVTFRAFAIAACAGLLMCDAGALEREPPRWQARQKGTEVSARDTQRLQGVERELDALRERVGENAAAIAQLRVQLAREQEDRRNASLLAFALALALALAGLLAWLALHRHRGQQLTRVSRWFELRGGGGPTALPSAAPDAAQPEVPSLVTAPAPDLDPQPLPVGAPSPLAGEGPRVRPGGAPRKVGAPELIEVHEKAEFFRAIGETAHAVAVLEAHVFDRVETGALPWLHLLELYQAQERGADCERLRAEFRECFGVDVPDAQHGTAPNPALDRIVALWPSWQVLEVIEESLLPGAGPLGLEAYRELLLLHHIARDLANADGTVAPQPPLGLLEPTATAPVERERERLMTPPASTRLGVDIELDIEPLGEPAASGEVPVLDFDLSAYEAPADAPVPARP